MLYLGFSFLFFFFVFDSTQEKSPLCYAIECGYVEYVELLLANGANIENGITPNSVLSNRQYGDFIDIATPLLFACDQKQEQIEIVKILLEYKCNVLFQNKKKQTAMDIASSHGHANITKLLYNHLINN